ncbi:hypothetical protein NC651_019592 [Populus alba x Populus x berolinensis]|nr:hypothetical protein NC651_019592 [Populus alba x Populus x berolinensis]
MGDYSKEALSISGPTGSYKPKKISLEAELKALQKKVDITTYKYESSPLRLESVIIVYKNLHMHIT